MTNLERIHIHGYRRLVDVAVELAPLAVMIGANGVGKTSFLEVWSLLAASCQAGLAERLSELGGVTDTMTRDKAKSIAFELSMSVPSHAPLEYHLTIEPQGQAYAIAYESLTQQNKPQPPPMKHIDSRGADIRYFDIDTSQLVRPTWDHNPQETSLSQVPKMFQAPENLRKSLASCAFYGPLDVAPGAPVRVPQALRPATLPGARGEVLVSCLFQLRETQRDRFDVLHDTLQTAFPDFERIDFPPVAAGMLAMTWKDRNYSQPMYMHQLSEGTLRFLWLATLLQSTHLPTVTLIDEPEVSLHPELLGLLAELMREASSRTQLIVATHSDRLIRFLRPNEVLVADLNEQGEATLTWGGEMDLDHWLADYTLDQLWEMGRLGGRA